VKKVIQILIGCVVSAAMLYLAFKDMKFAELRESFSQIAWWPVLPFIAIFGVHVFLRSLRWRYLLPEAKRQAPTIRQLFDSMLLGNFATFLLPFRPGEVIRPLILSRWTEYSFATAFVSVVIERFFDLAAVLVTFFILIQLLPDVPPWLHVAAYSLGSVASGLLFFLIGGCLFPNFISSLVRVCAKPLPTKIETFVVSFSSDLLKGAAVIKSPKRLAIILGLTVCVWLTAYLQFQALLFIFPHDRSFLLSVALGVFVALAIALPTTPGFVGAFQVGCVEAARFFAYPVSAAQVYSLVVHGLTYVVFIVIGVWLLNIHNLNLFQLRKEAERGS
jgi:uncharacterized protein (TIRG00374 family)